MDENVNIYDYIGEFYAQDPGWNELLPHKLVEGYAREKMWQGMPEERILEIWDTIMVLCVYLGNTEIMLNNMRQSTFIDCLGWCRRNVADFGISAPEVEEFLDNLQDFFTYLYKKGFISYPNAPQDTKEEVLQDGRVLMIRENGFFTEAYEQRHDYLAPDAPQMIFLSMGEKLERTLTALQNFYNDNPEFKDDLHRARFFYNNLLLVGASRGAMSEADYENGFWDYFLFDYHMLCGIGTPIDNALENEIYNEENCEELSVAILEELRATKLKFFSVLGLENGQYKCKCALTDEVFYALLPLVPSTDFNDVVFQGHVFYEDSMVVNFVKGLRMQPHAKKVALRAMETLRKWASVRCGFELPWDMFIESNPILTRHAFLLSSAGVDRVGVMPPSSYLDGKYEPSDILYDTDDITQLLDAAMGRFLFSAEDICIAQTMWADYLRVTGIDAAKLTNPGAWLVAIMCVYSQVNEVFNYDMDSFVAPVQRYICKEDVPKAMEQIKQALAIEPNDARYLSEEGLLVLFLRD